MDVDETTTEFKSEHAGENFYFCSQECKDTFDSQPKSYEGTAA
jgi:Cu+-exporting ATPase